MLGHESYLLLHNCTHKSVTEVTDVILSQMVKLSSALDSGTIDLNTFKFCVMQEGQFLSKAFDHEAYIERLTDKSYIKRRVNDFNSLLKEGEFTRRTFKVIKNRTKPKMTVEDYRKAHPIIGVPATIGEEKRPILVNPYVIRSYDGPEKVLEVELPLGPHMPKRHNLQNVHKKIERKIRRKVLNKGKYASGLMISERRFQNERNDDFLKSKELSSGSQRFSLGSLEDQIRKKFNEMYMQVSAMEIEANRKHMRWMFVTMTCPSEFHPNPTNGIGSWNGCSMRDAVKYLNKQWDNAKKHLARKGVSLSKGDAFGFRVIEPHKDGCPHLHALLFVKDEDIRAVSEEIYSQFDYEGFLGHKNSDKFQERMDVLEKKMRTNFRSAKTKSTTIILNALDNSGNKEVASAKSYVTKYLLKNTNSTSINQSDEIISKQGAEAVDAWRSCVKARAFSVIGRKGVLGAWREIRKVRNSFIYDADKETQRILLLCKGMKMVKATEQKMEELRSSGLLIERRGNRALIQSWARIERQLS